MRTNPQTFRDACSQALAAVNVQCDAVKEEAEKLGISHYNMRDSSGNWVYTPLLLARAQLLNALALLNQKER